MSRNRRFPRVLLLAALLCAAFASAAAPDAQAAAHTYYVDSAKDDGVGGTPSIFCIDANPNNKNCTLRQALTLAETDGGTTEVRFIIPATSDPDYGYDGASQVWTIKPGSVLPTLAAGGTTVTGRLSFSGAPRIVIDGTGVPSTSAVGFKITSAGNTIQRLAIVNFKDTGGTNGFGILISGASATGNSIVSNYIGAAPSGNVKQPNSGAGVRIDTNASTNTIGGVDIGDRNIISGNGTGVISGTGVLLANANNNTIQGNFIGLGVGSSGTVPLGNTGAGIQISDSSGNTIGGEFDARNVISANGSSGVLLTGSGSTNNTISDNIIGADENGLLAGFGNGGDGVHIVNQASNNTISGSESTHSVISGNAGYGVYISDGGTSGNKVLSSYIGVADDGSTARPNARGGVRILNNAANTVVGGASQGNVIAGNVGYGVALGGTGGGFTQIFSNTIAANYIGLSFDGTAAVANSRGGVLLDIGSLQNRVGGASAALQNVISGNGGAGVVVSGTATLDNVIAGNVIGLKRTPGNSKLIFAAPNSGDGVLIAGGAQGTRVGGTSAEANVIAANSGNGVHISGSGTTTTTVQANLIGTALDGSTYLGLGNAQNGVLAENAASTVTITGSKIYSNTLNGVLVDSGAQRVKITNNSISRNAGTGIKLNPATIGPPGNPANANHDIDPPFNLNLTQSRILTGRVLADGSSAACNTCTIQIFTPDPALLDRQGRDKINVPVTLTSNGYFTATLPNVPSQVLVTATDGAGNTSEFAFFERIFRLAIGPARPQQEAIPGQTITFTHRVTNTGTIGFTDLHLAGVSTPNWPLTLNPASTFSLAAGASIPITLTLMLPTGADPRVYAGTLNHTRITVSSTSLPTVTASITDTTLVKPQFLLSAVPPALSGLAKKSTTIAYAHTLTNNGNISTTVLLTASTDLNWGTTISPISYLIQPGQAISATVHVTTPDAVQANTVAKTTIRITSPGQPDRTQDKILTDTTTITSTALATLIPNNDGDAAAGQTISLPHIVTNLSNGPATFMLFASSSLGSTITFTSTNNIPIGPDNTFTLGTTLGTNQLNFYVNVRVNPLALPGSTDLITIGLKNSDGVVIGEASAQDTVHVTLGQSRPRAYLPVVMK